MALPENPTSGVRYNYPQGRPLPWHVVDPGRPLTDLTVDDLARVYEETPSVRRVIDFIARSIAILPWHAFHLTGEDNARERIADDPAELLIRHPDPDRAVTGYALIRDLVTDQLVYGRSLCLLMDGVPTRIPPRLISEKRDFLGRLERLEVCAEGVEYQVNDGPFAYVTDWRGDVTRPYGTLRTLRGLIEEMNKAADYRRVLWRESMKITSTLNLDPGKTLTRAQRQEFEERLNEFKQERSSGNLVLEGWEYNPVTPQPVVSNADLDMRNLTDADVATFFGLAPEVLGVRKGTYGSISVFRKMLYGPTLGAHIEALQQALNLQIVPAITKTSGVVFGEFDIDSASEGTPAERAATLQTEVGAPIKTIAEARAELNLPYKEGTDELITPLNVMAGGGSQASATDSGSQNWNAHRENPYMSNEEKAWSPYESSQRIISLLKSSGRS